MSVLRFVGELGEGFTSRPLRATFLGTLGLIVFLYPFGIAFVAAGLLPDRFSWTASVIIALNGIVVLLSELRAGPARRALGIFAVLVSILFGVEYLGSQTGFPFGAYAYTGALGLTVAGVPPVIAIAWYGTVICIWRIVQAVTSRREVWWTAVLAGTLAVALDLVLEPVAAGVERYWVWDGGSVPVQNYASWFVFTAVAVLAIERSATSPPPSGLVTSAALVLGMQWSLFVVTTLVHGMMLPVVGSLLLAASVAILARVRRTRAEREAAA